MMHGQRKIKLAYSVKYFYDKGKSSCKFYICVKPSKTTNLLKPGYRNSLYKFIRTTRFGRYSTIVRSAKTWWWSSNDRNMLS